MTMRTVDWTAPRAPGTAAAEAEGLRERKKRLMRQQLSDTATQMFMDRGFAFPLQEFHRQFSTVVGT